MPISPATRWCRLRDSLLLQACQLCIAFLPRSVNLVAGGWSHIGERQHPRHRSRMQRRFQLLRQSHQDLESDFLLPRLDPAHHVHGSGRRRLGATQSRHLHQFPALSVASAVDAFNIRGVTASKVSVTVAERFTCRVASAIGVFFPRRRPIP